MVKVGVAIQNAEARIQAEVAQIVQSMRSDYEAAVAEERSLTATLNRQKGEAQVLNRTGIEYGVLQRDDEANRQMFESAAEAHAGNRHLRGAEGREHPRRRPGRNTARAGVAEYVQQPADRAARRPGARRRPRLRVRVRRRPHQEPGRVEEEPRAALPRDGAGALRQDDHDAAHHRRRAESLRRELPLHPHQRAVLVGRRRVAPRRRHQLRARRRQDGGLDEPVAGAGAGGPSRAADRRRHAQAARPRGLLAVRSRRDSRTSWLARHGRPRRSTSRRSRASG